MQNAFFIPLSIITLQGTVLLERCRSISPGEGSITSLVFDIALINLTYSNLLLLQKQSWENLSCWAKNDNFYHAVMIRLKTKLRSTSSFFKCQFIIL